MSMNEPKQTDSRADDTRRAYSTPSLIVFGDFATLTMSGGPQPISDLGGKSSKV